jgi:ABC-type amino acid transport substrate-binding protein
MERFGFKQKRMCMFSKCIGLLFVLGVLWSSWPSLAKADELMRRIEEKGKIRIGFQEDVTPFASYDEIAEVHRGFSVDMARQLVLFLSKRFGKHIVLEPVNLKAGQRVPMIVNGAIDVEMGASTKTYPREKSVDFSIVYFTSETTFLANKRSGIGSIGKLNGKRIAVGAGTTNLRLLEELSLSGQLSSITILPFDNHNLALWALVSGKADAYCADRVLLTTKRLQTPDPENWLILEESIGYEPYAFMLPENNSDFRDFINDTIRWTILTGTYFETYEKWMGPLGIGPFRMSPSFKEYLNVISYPIPEDWWAQ